MSRHSYEIDQLIKAFSLAQQDLKNPKHSGKGYNWTYATDEDIKNIVIPILSKHDLIVLQENYVYSNVTYLFTRMYHIPSGQWREDMRPLLPEEETQQSRGSAETYQKRYALLTICGLSSKSSDDDGQSGKDAYNARRSFVGHGKTISKEEASTLENRINELPSSQRIKENIFKFNNVSSYQSLTASQYKKIIDYLDKLKT